MVEAGTYTELLAKADFSRSAGLNTLQHDAYVQTHSFGPAPASGCLAPGLATHGTWVASPGRDLLVVLDQTPPARRSCALATSRKL